MKNQIQVLKNSSKKPRVFGKINGSPKKRIKNDIKNSLPNSTLFDSVKFTKDIENNYLKLINEKN